MNQTKFFGSVATLLSLSIMGAAAQDVQFKAVTECYPNVEKSINGVDEFDREKFINMAASSSEAAAKLTPKEADYLFKELEIKIGRGLGLVKGEYKWGKSVREDSARPGYTDLEYLRKNIKRNTTNVDYYKTLFGESERMAIHDSHDAYPDFMPKFNLTPGSTHDQFPENTDAAGELAAHILKYKYDDFSRPQHFEAVNEPHWQYWKDERFWRHHTDIKRHVDALGLDIEVGGPCLAVSNFYNNQFRSTRQMTDFIDGTKNALDFYSFHTYDYYEWDKSDREWKGQINSGAPLEGVFDAISSYTYNKYGKEWRYVATEHGGYIQSKSHDPLTTSAMRRWTTMQRPTSRAAV